MTLYRRPDLIFHYDLRDGERRDAGSTGTRNKRAAKRIYRERWRAFWRKPDLEPDGAEAVSAPLPLLQGRRGRKITIAAVAAEYVKDVRKRFRSAEGARERAASVSRLVTRLGPAKPFFSLTEDDLEPICVFHEDRGVAPRTVNGQVYEPAHALFSFARDRLKLNYPCNVFWSAIRRRLKNERVRVLNPAEMGRLLDKAPDKEGRVHEFAWTTGFRAREIVDLRWSDIDRHAGMITTEVKNGRLHSVPISTRVGQILDDLEGDHDEFVFTYVADKAQPEKGYRKNDRVPYTYQTLWYRARKLFDAAGIRNYRFHDHRHTAASRMLRVSNGNMRIVQDLLGHLQLKSCSRYSHLHAGAVAAEMEKLETLR